MLQRTAAWGPRLLSDRQLSILGSLLLHSVVHTKKTPEPQTRAHSVVTGNISLHTRLTSLNMKPEGEIPPTDAAKNL